MAFRRACSYEATIKTPVSPSEYSAILVTFKQGDVAVQKRLADLELTLTSVIVRLKQEETALLEKTSSITRKSLTAFRTASGAGERSRLTEKSSATTKLSKRIFPKNTKIPATLHLAEQGFLTQTSARKGC